MRRDRSSVHVLGRCEWLDEGCDTVDDNASPFLLRHLLAVKKGYDSYGRKRVNKIEYIKCVHGVLQVEKRQTLVHVRLHFRQQLHKEDASLRQQAATKNRHRQLRFTASRSPRDHRQVVKQNGITQQRVQSASNRTRKKYIGL